MTSSKRPYKKHLRVPVNFGEEEIIKKQAKNCGLSVSEYLRSLGLGYEPRSNVDYQKVRELAKINGDLGRLGGLLKLWLSSDRHAAHFDKKEINIVLSQIKGKQNLLAETMLKIIKQR